MPTSNRAVLTSLLIRAMTTPLTNPGVAFGPAMRLNSTPPPCNRGWRNSPSKLTL